MTGTSEPERAVPMGRCCGPQESRPEYQPVALLSNVSKICGLIFFFFGRFPLEKNDCGFVHLGKVGWCLGDSRYQELAATLSPRDLGIDLARGKSGHPSSTGVLPCVGKTG